MASARGSVPGEITWIPAPTVTMSWSDPGSTATRVAAASPQPTLTRMPTGNPHDHASAGASVPTGAVEGQTRGSRRASIPAAATTGAHQSLATTSHSRVADAYDGSVTGSPGTNCIRNQSLGATIVSAAWMASGS